jgi:hypothetical protein
VGRKTFSFPYKEMKKKKRRKISEKGRRGKTAILLRFLSCRCGGMVDAVDSKSTLGNQVLVRVRPSALTKKPFS